MQDITYRWMTIKDCKSDLFRDFNRYQEVSCFWRNVDGQWVLRDEYLEMQWDKKKLRKIAKELNDQLKHGYCAYSAWAEDRLIGRVTIAPHLFGSAQQYIQLKDLHVTYEYRGQGIGKQLFKTACDKARELGAKKLYISSFSANETYQFYAAMGCVDAKEIDSTIFSQEPMDRHLELEL